MATFHSPFPVSAEMPSNRARELHIVLLFQDEFTHVSARFRQNLLAKMVEGVLILSLDESGERHADQLGAFPFQQIGRGQVDLVDQVVF